MIEFSEKELEWHLELLKQMEKGFHETQVNLSVSCKNQNDRQKNDLLFAHFLAQVELLRNVMILRQRKDFLSARILLSSLIESIILVCYLNSNKQHMNDYWCFSVIKRLSFEPILSKDSILGILTDKNNEVSIKNLKKKNVNFNGDNDYLRRSNYKSNWCPKLNEICELLKNQYDDTFVMWYQNYKKHCDYKHFDSTMMFYNSLRTSLDLLDSNTFKGALYYSEVEYYDIYINVIFPEIVLLDFMEQTYCGTCLDINKIKEYKKKLKEEEVPFYIDILSKIRDSMTLAPFFSEK